MRVFLFFLFFFGSILGASANGLSAVVCTMEYAPVCGQPKMPECSAGMSCAQVMPALETFPNQCIMQAKGATLVRQGECSSSGTSTSGGSNTSSSSSSGSGGGGGSSPSGSAGGGSSASSSSSSNSTGGIPVALPVNSSTNSGAELIGGNPVIVGGDKDKNGCIGSAGYTWNKIANKCVRPWESKVVTMTIGPKFANCTGVGSMKCIQLKKANKWTYFYSPINGFEYVPGYTYRIQVLESKIENPPADGSDKSYELIKILTKKPTAKTLKDTLFHGDWKLQSYNSKKVKGNYTAQFESNRASFKFCNSMSGEYTLNGNVFTTSGFISTEMYCQGIAMTLENNFNLDGAVYSLKTTKSIPAQSILTITTKKGNVFVFRK